MRLSVVARMVLLALFLVAVVLQLVAVVVEPDKKERFMILRRQLRWLLLLAQHRVIAPSLGQLL
jgi:hypothetical protein